MKETYIRPLNAGTLEELFRDCASRREAGAYLLFGSQKRLEDAAAAFSSYCGSKEEDPVFLANPLHTSGELRFSSGSVVRLLHVKDLPAAGRVNFCLFDPMSVRSPDYGAIQGRMVPYSDPSEYDPDPELDAFLSSIPIRRE